MQQGRVSARTGQATGAIQGWLNPGLHLQRLQQLDIGAEGRLHFVQDGIRLGADAGRLQGEVVHVPALDETRTP